MVGRLRKLGISAAVTLGVFVYLALPLLQEMFGPGVNLPVYAAIAVLAGAVTWSVVNGISEAVDEEPAGVGARRELQTDDETDEAGPRPTPDVDSEMEQLREER